MLRSLFSASLLFISHVSAEVTIYASFGQAPGALPTPCIGAVPCDGAVINPIHPGDQFDTSEVTVNNTIPVQLYTDGMDGLSIPIPNHFFGFSLELSVINHLLGNSGENLDPVFLNLMSTIVARSNSLVLRVGGNSQERSVFVPEGLERGAMIEKGLAGSSTTQTPALLVAPSLIYTMANISGFLPTIEWFLGVPFNDTDNPRMEIAELGQQLLGDKLVGLQLGNEPDLYHQNSIRESDYSPEQYDSEWGKVLGDYVGNENILNSSMFVAPSVCCGPNPGWTPEQVWDTGFLDHYNDNLAFIAVQHYPSDNCNGSTHYDPQVLLQSTYLNHNVNQNQNLGYLNSSSIAQSYGKPFLIFETNSASCGGFSGLSDSFAASLWAVDYSLNMAMGNVSHMLFHVGGQSDYYNSFTPPASNQSGIRQWTIGSTFYSALVIAEALGSSPSTPTARVVDLYLNGNSPYTPGYVIYDAGKPDPQRVVLMNFVTDTNEGDGSGNYTAYLSVGGGETGQANATPETVRVKYLLASSISEKFDINWAGQTFGGPFQADGRLQGSEIIYTYTCDTANNVCAIPVPAPGLALVYLTDDALENSGFGVGWGTDDDGNPPSTTTFATTAARTNAANTATIDQAVLATSNGRGGGQWTGVGSTSFGSVSSATTLLVSTLPLLVVGMISGMMLCAGLLV